MFGCFLLTPDSESRFRAFCKNIPVLHNKYESFITSLDKLGFTTFESKIDEIIVGLVKDRLDYLKTGAVYINFTVYNGAWYSTDLFNAVGVRIARLADVAELDRFLFFYKLSDADKLKFLEEALTELKLRYRYNPDSVKRKTGINIPASANGLGPDYRLVKDKVYDSYHIVYGNDPDRYANVSITYTGNREADYEAAFQAAGITAAAEKQSALELYVWHHLDDFDPVTGKGTMQLVLKEFHNSKVYGSVFDHIGGVAVWEQFYNMVKYK